MCGICTTIPDYKHLVDTCINLQMNCLLLVPSNNVTHLKVIFGNNTVHGHGLFKMTIS